MSTTRSSTPSEAVSGCRPADIEPVAVAAADLDSTAPEYLRDLKAEFAAAGYQPAQLDVVGRFAEDCSLATQEEADRIRGYVRAASFLGAGRVTVAVEEVADPEKVRPALSALRERADREGVTLSVEGLELSA